MGTGMAKPENVTLVPGYALALQAVEQARIDLALVSIEQAASIIREQHPDAHSVLLQLTDEGEPSIIDPRDAEFNYLDPDSDSEFQVNGRLVWKCVEAIFDTPRIDRDQLPCISEFTRYDGHRSCYLYVK